MAGKGRADSVTEAKRGENNPEKNQGEARIRKDMRLCSRFKAEKILELLTQQRHGGRKPRLHSAEKTSS